MSKPTFHRRPTRSSTNPSFQDSTSLQAPASDATLTVQASITPAQVPAQAAVADSISRQSSRPSRKVRSQVLISYASSVLSSSFTVLRSHPSPPSSRDEECFPPHSGRSYSSPSPEALHCPSSPTELDDGAELVDSSLPVHCNNQSSYLKLIPKQSSRHPSQYTQCHQCLKFQYVLQYYRVLLWSYQPSAMSILFSSLIMQVEIWSCNFLLWSCTRNLTPSVFIVIYFVLHVRHSS